MNDKITIWFLGSNSVGKTTQGALIHLLMRKIMNEEDYTSVVHSFMLDDLKCSYTQVSPISANLGVFNHPLTTQDKNIKTNACCGTDNLSTKAQIQAAYEAALDNPQIKIITVDAIMATGQFINFLRNDKSKLMVILLDCSENINFKRLAQRRAIKLGIDPSEIILADKTKENLSTKLRNFRSTFKKAAAVADSHLAIDTDILPIEDVHDLILETFLWSI